MDTISIAREIAREYYGIDGDELDGFMDDCYMGHYDEKEDFARECVEEQYDTSKWPYNYIDYDYMTRDMECSGEYDFHESDDVWGYFVFRTWR